MNVGVFETEVKIASYWIDCALSWYAVCSKKNSDHWIVFCLIFIINVMIYEKKNDSQKMSSYTFLLKLKTIYWSDDSINACTKVQFSSIVVDWHVFPCLLKLNDIIRRFLLQYLLERKSRRNHRVRCRAAFCSSLRAKCKFHCDQLKFTTFWSP